MVLKFLVTGLRGISRVAEVYGTYSTSLKDLYSYFGPKVTETEPQGPSLGAQLESVACDVSTIKGGLNASGDQLKSVAYDVSTIKGGMEALHGVLSDVCVSCDEIMEYMKEKKKREKDKERQVFVENVGNVLITIIKSKEKFESKDLLEITIGVSDIVSSAGQLISTVSTPYGPFIGIIFGVIGAILTEIKPQKDQQPSVVDQLARVVHDKLVCFNKRLQDQKYDGLKRRVSEQQFQLRTMEPGEELDDPNLWTDYAQFMGELANRFESPLPLKYENNLTRDPDVADFVTAIVMYCEAHCCFIALLIAAKGKFAELGRDEKVVDRKISYQKDDAIKKLSFLSDERYLKFLGTLPYEGGKLTKIVVLSQNISGKGLVEAVRGRLGLKPMRKLKTVKEAASKVARQSVKVKADRHRVPQPQGNWLYWLYRYTCSGKEFLVQFINETPFPMKIVSCSVDLGETSPKIEKVVQSSESVWVEYTDFQPAGYVTIYLNGTPSPSTEPPAGQARVFEFAFIPSPQKLNIQDKTSMFTYGQDTYNEMIGSKSIKEKTLYWFEKEKHFITRGEVIDLSQAMVLRFVAQEYDPCSVQDIIQR